ncbi:hypothetical protein MOQ_009992, partial [Trypanosoma cruzi marinkellei]
MDEDGGTLAFFLEFRYFSCESICGTSFASLQG